MENPKSIYRPVISWLMISAALAGLGLLLTQGKGLLSVFCGLALLGFFLAWLSNKQTPITLHSLAMRLFPLALGLLLLPMNLFYWDRFDWQTRLDFLLLALALIYFGRLFRQTRLLSSALNLFASLSHFKRILTVFLLCLASFCTATLFFARQQVPLSGDEPHYLIIAQSLAEDGDLNVANQYYQNLYEKYLGVENIGIHGYFGKNGQHEIYSMHLPGVAISITPLLWLMPPGPQTVLAIHLLLGLYAALLMVVVYLCLWRLIGNCRLALLCTLIMAWTAPLFYHSFHFYPEAQVMLLLLSSLYLRYLSPHRHKPWALLLSGLCLGLLLFWGVKYALFLYMYGFGAIYGLLKKKDRRSAILFMIGPLLMQGLFWGYLYAAYGNFSPASVYQNELQKSQFWGVMTIHTTLKMRLEAFLNYFLDQRDGLLLYAPIYTLALAGFCKLLAQYRRYKRLFWIILPALLYIGSYAFMTHRGGHSPQARPLAPVTWALLLLVLFLFRHSQLRFLKRTLAGGLVLYGFFITLFQLFNPYTLYQATTHDVQFRPGFLFQRLSNAMLDLPQFLPSFIKTDGNEAWWPNLVFISLLFALTLFVLWRKKPLVCRLVCKVWLPLWLVVFVLFPRLPLYNPILIERADLLAHRLYGVSFYPRRAQGRSFHIRDAKSVPILLSPLAKMDELGVRIKNLSDQNLTLSLWNFDQKMWTDEVAAQAELTVALPNWVHKRWQGEDYIQLHVWADSPQPDFEMEVLPRGRRQSQF